MSGRFFKTGWRLLIASSSVFVTSCYEPPHERTPEWDVANGEKRPDRLTAQQALAEGVPASPDSFSPDPSVNPPLEPRLPELEIRAETTIDQDPLLPPANFNPDPGMGTDAGGQKATSGATKQAENSMGGGRFFKDEFGNYDNRFFSRDAGAPKEFPKFEPAIPNSL